MNIRASRWVALSAWAFSLALVALGLLLTAANRYVENEIEPSGELVAVVEKTIQPAHVSLWLRDREDSTGRQRSS